MDTGKKLCSNRPCKYKLILIPGGLRYRPSFRTKRREGDLFYKTCSKASGERQIHPFRFTLASQGILYPILIESTVGNIQGERGKVFYFGKGKATGLDKSHKNNEINFRKCVIWLPMEKNEIAQCKKLMSTNTDMHVKKTVNSVLVTLDRCGKHELAATLLRKGSFVALIRSAEIEEYCQNLKDRGNWHSLQHGNYGILIDTRIPIPQQYNEFVELAQKISEEFAEIEEWYHT